MSHKARPALILFILLVLLTMALWGCSSDAEDVTTTTGRATATTAPSSTGNGTEALVGTRLEPTEDSPAEIAEAMEQAKPVVMLFYVPAGVDDQKVLENLTLLQSDFPEYVFLLYDYSEPDEYGDLSLLLAVDYPPALILVDGTGTVDAVWNGYVDEGSLNQSLVNLGA